MMSGIVNAALEATLPLQLHGPNSYVDLTAVIDTGCNGALSLPISIITKLGLSSLAARSVTLGDGSHRMLDFYDAEVLWDGQRQNIPVLCVEGDPLIGTALLKRFRMEADFIASGQVRITARP